MDPNANLRDQEELLQEIDEYDDNPGHPARHLAIDDLRAARAGLSDWLARGGFEPDWSKAPNAAKYYRRG